MGYNTLLDNTLDRLIHNGPPAPVIMYYQDSTCMDNRLSREQHKNPECLSIACRNTSSIFPDQLSLLCWVQIGHASSLQLWHRSLKDSSLSPGMSFSLFKFAKGCKAEYRVCLLTFHMHAPTPIPVIPVIPVSTIPCYHCEKSSFVYKFGKWTCAQPLRQQTAKSHDHQKSHCITHLICILRVRTTCQRYSFPGSRPSLDRQVWSARPEHACYQVRRSLHWRYFISWTWSCRARRNSVDDGAFLFSSLFVIAECPCQK